MIPRGTWRNYINRQVLRDHLKWIRNQGGTRLALRNCNLDDLPARGTQLNKARFERCTFRRADLSYSQLADMELEDCVLDHASFISSDMDRSHLYRCRFAKADLRITRLRMADIVGSDFSGALLDRADFKSAILKETSFRGALVYDATLDDAYVGDCNWCNADLSLQKMDNLCTTTGIWFFRCDLRGVNLQGRRLKNTRFTECRFYGIHGQPVLEGTCIIEQPNFAPDKDGEDIGTADRVLQMWGG